MKVFEIRFLSAVIESLELCLASCVRVSVTAHILSEWKNDQSSFRFLLFAEPIEKRGDSEDRNLYGRSTYKIEKALNGDSAFGYE